MRSPVSLRPAEHDDAEALVELWETMMRRADREDLVVDARRMIAESVGDPTCCIVLAEIDGVIAGSVYLRATTITPVNLEPVVQAISPQVAPHFRGRGVGRALMEAAVSYAEERGIGHVASAATAGSRDANRFMARLALGPIATLRLAPAAAVRAKLAARGPAGRGASRQLSQVVAARRSLRRSRADAAINLVR